VAVAATVSPSSSPQKRPPLVLGYTLHSNFKKGKLPGKDAAVDANYVKEKEGMFDLQIIYPRNLFEVGAKFAPLFIKVVQYRYGKIEPVFIFNNEYFTKALTGLVDNHKVDGMYPDLGLPYLNAAIRRIDVMATRAKKFDDDTQECRHGKFLTTHLTNFVKCTASADGTLDRIKGFAEWMQIQLSESAEDNGEVYYPFENIFKHGATQGVLKWWGENDKKLTRSIGYTVGTLQTLDECFRHDYVKMDVQFYLSLGTDLQHQPLSSWPANALDLGWKKHQHQALLGTTALYYFDRN
jgi:hypothetical protein